MRFVAMAALMLCAAPVSAQTLQEQLTAEGAPGLARAAQAEGDVQRGALLFHQPHLACVKCHGTADAAAGTLRFGPDLTRLGKEIKPEHLVESILDPSRVIARGFESVTAVTAEGKPVSGLLVENRPDSLTLREPSEGRLLNFKKSDLDELVIGKTSIMPANQANMLANRQQFLDLVRYLFEIAQEGPERARQLQPPASMFVLKLPTYEEHVDHAGLIRAWDQASYQRGEAIYQRVCANCHGTVEQPGSLPISLRFAEGKFKNGADPHSMYQTLTRGYGFMVPQAWMVPRQKYDVIHYIRKAYLERHNPAQLTTVDDAYLSRLPHGDTFGPEPSSIEPWSAMDYGPSLINTYEIPPVAGAAADSDALNFAYKGIAVRLDPGPGGVSRGRQWMIFDHDTLRMAAAWRGTGFIDWNGIHFNGRHQIHPRLVGTVLAANPVGPGWANPETGSFEDPRLRGRDGRPYGPLPRTWAHYRGRYDHGDRTIIDYTVGNTSVLEMPGMATLPGYTEPVFTRTFQIGPRQRDMLLAVASVTGDGPQQISGDKVGSALYFAPQETADGAVASLAFGGSLRIDVDHPEEFDLDGRDYTITARIRTRGNGVLFSQAAEKGRWIPNGKSFFVRDGRLVFDIGWVGAVTSKSRVNDGRWHDVAMTWSHETGAVRLYVDRRPDGEGRLKPKAILPGSRIRLGYAATDFPDPSYFTGDISELRFYQRALPVAELPNADTPRLAGPDLIADWKFSRDPGKQVSDLSGHHHEGLVEGKPTETAAPGGLVVGVPSAVADGWDVDSGKLRMRIAAGKTPLHFTLWMGAAGDRDSAKDLAAAVTESLAPANLTELTRGGPRRWNQTLTTTGTLGSDAGPFAVDEIVLPNNNPWLAQMRTTGFDFYPDGDRAAVCTWDGDVWLLSGLREFQPSSSASSKSPQFTWQRIATGLFQPLGLKLIDGKIYVTCRDQIVILHDLNGDGETDFYENFNNDHQVTEHFHEFAMGLQVDAAGNLYYAKSARHALPAVVPHHGTLLRVSPDGSRTDILAVGFRAANGVCLNPDGSFIVTDQEGHWNPKNRINWVTLDPSGKAKFYGNMFGYHDVTDSSNEAMVPPLCWITNAFDRSPAELLWVDSKRWGLLNGALLNLSYGYGKIFVVPHEDIDGQKQGGLCELPIPNFPTGVMRGRFHPVDGQLYVCGMFAWAGNATQAGGFYRVRATGRPMHLPTELHAKRDGMELKFTAPLDPESVQNPENWTIKTWGLRRSADYGSPHLNEKKLAIRAVRLSEDRRTVFVEIPDIQPTWCMEIGYRVKTAEGAPLTGVIHNTIHKVGPVR